MFMMFRLGNIADVSCNDALVKSVHIRSFSGSYFSAFGLNTERCGVSLERYGIVYKCEKMQTIKIPNMDTSHGVIAV